MYGNLNGRGTCATGAVLAPGAQYRCSFTVTFTGPPGASQTDVVTVPGGRRRRPVRRRHRRRHHPHHRPAAADPGREDGQPAGAQRAGSTFTFSVTITNVGPEDVTITDLTDDVYGNLNGRGTCAVGAVLPHNGGTYTCSFTGDFFGNAGASQTDIVTASGVDNDGSRTTARDDAVVRLVDVPPTVTVVKDADPASRVDPGGAFTFFVTVNNTSFEPVTVVSLTDDVYGNLNGRGTCAIGAVIPAGGSYRCQFTVDFRGPGGSSQVDRVFVTVVDNDGSRASANDDARISITPLPVVPPTLPPAVVPTVPPPVVCRAAGPHRLRRGRPRPPRPRPAGGRSPHGGGGVGFREQPLRLCSGGWRSRPRVVAGGPGGGGGPGRFTSRFTRPPSGGGRGPGGSAAAPPRTRRPTPASGAGRFPVDEVLVVDVVESPSLAGTSPRRRRPSHGGRTAASARRRDRVRPAPVRGRGGPAGPVDGAPAEPAGMTIAERAATTIVPGSAEAASAPLGAVPPPAEARRVSTPTVEASSPELRITRLF